MHNSEKPGLSAWLAREKWGLLLLLIAAIALGGLVRWLSSGETADALGGDFAEYEKGGHGFGMNNNNNISLMITSQGSAFGFYQIGLQNFFFFFFFKQ